MPGALVFLAMRSAPMCLVLAAVACERRPVHENPPPAPGPQPIRAPVDAAAPVVDAAAPVDPAKVVTAAWPTAVEMVMVEPPSSSGNFTMSVSYPRFRIRPKELADAINAELGAPAKVDFSRDDDRTGSFYYNCTPITVSRIAVMVRCGRMLDSHTKAELAAGTGGSPAGPMPSLYAWWLQPGLPAMTIDQFAPNTDVAKLIATAKQIDNADCHMSDCALDAESWIFDGDGITFTPTDYCAGCEEYFPKLAFAELAPQHPWAVKLVAWLKQRVAAGESLVKYGVAP
jgi:hypothetical protein